MGSVGGRGGFARVMRRVREDPVHPSHGMTRTFFPSGGGVEGSTGMQEPAGKWIESCSAWAINCLERKLGGG